MILTDLHPAYYTDSVTLYTEAFPEIERRDVAEWEEFMQRRKEFHAQAIIEDDAFSGFITWWDFDDFVYGEHFAICAEKRSGGLGGRAFDLFLTQHNNRDVVIEVEMPSDEMARRRICFYERHGMSVVEKDYLQPPYRLGEEYFPLLLMSTDATRTLHNFEHIKNTIHREVYGVKESQGKK